MALGKSQPSKITVRVLREVSLPKILCLSEWLWATSQEAQRGKKQKLSRSFQHPVSKEMLEIQWSGIKRGFNVANIKAISFLLLKSCLVQENRIFILRRSSLSGVGKILVFSRRHLIWEKATCFNVIFSLQYQSSAIRWQFLFMPNYCKTRVWQLSGGRSRSGEPFVPPPSEEVMKLLGLMANKWTEGLSLFYICRKEVDTVFQPHF